MSDTAVERGRSPQVSVIVTSYNYGHFISKAIESIQSQTFDDLEILVLDNASSDDTVETVRALAEHDDRIEIIARDRNIGGVENASDGHRRASGEFCLDIDADDWALRTDAIELQVDLLRSNPTVSFAFNRVAHCSTDGALNFERGAFESNRVVSGAEALGPILHSVVQHSGTIFRRDAYRAVGGYDLTYRVQNDLKLYADLCAIGHVGYLDLPLYAWHQHSQSHSQTEDVRLMLGELVRLIDDAIDGPMGRQLDEPERLRRTAIAESLLAGPTSAIFAGNVAAGIRELMIGIRLRPRPLLSNPRLLALFARSALGASGYRYFEQQLRRFHV